MVKTVISVLFVFLAVWGLCEAIYIIKMLFYYPGKCCNSFVVITLKENLALRQLNFFWQKLKWQGSGYAKNLIAITDCIKPNELVMCIDFARNKDIVLCDLNSLTQCECLQGEYINGNR